MKRNLILAVVLLVVAAILAGIYMKETRLHSAETSRGASPTVRIGAILPLTGDLAAYGTSFRDAALMAKEDSGKTQLDYKFLFEDDQDCSAKYDVLGAQKLVSVDRVNALLSMWDAWFVVTPTTQPKGVIHIGMSWDLQKFRSQLAFVHYPPVEKFVATFLKEAKSRGYRKIAFVGEQGGGETLMEKELRRVIAEHGMELVFDEFFNQGEKDFHTLIAKVTDRKPDLVMILSWPPSLDVFLKQYREYKVGIPLAGMEIWFDSTMKKEFEGSWEVAGDAPGNEFEGHFVKRWGYHPDIGAGYFYDNAALLIRTYEALYQKLHRVATGAEVAQYFHDHPVFEGAQGRTTVTQDNWIIAEPSVVELHGAARVKIK
jgi:branched-chain amino acid transport system substrate-binding protein